MKFYKTSSNPAVVVCKSCGAKITREYIQRLDKCPKCKFDGNKYGNLKVPHGVEVDRFSLK